MTATQLKQRATRVYIYVMLMVFPLFTGFRGYSAITGAKLAFYIASTALWFIFLLVVSLRKKHGSIKRRFSPVEICLLIYLAACCVSAVLSPHESAVILGAGRFDGLVAAILSVCIFFGVSRNAKLERGYIYALAISMSLCCLAAFFQLLGKNPLGLFPNGYTYGDMGIKYSGEFLGTIGNANLFSAFLVLCLPILTCFFIVGSRRRYFLLPLIALGAFCLFACTVSAGKLALLVCAVAAAPVLILRKTRLNRRRFLCAYAALLVLGAAAAFLYLTRFYTGADSTLYELSSVLRGDIQDSFGSSRILIWRNCLQLISERPLFGGGPGTVALRLDINFSRFVEETGRTLSSSVDNAHNVYLGILADTGVFALTSYIAAMSLTLVKAAENSKSHALALCLACGLLGYWIQDFFGLGLFLVSPIMWITWGLAARHD